MLEEEHAERIKKKESLNFKLVKAEPFMKTMMDDQVKEKEKIETSRSETGHKEKIILG